MIQGWLHLILCISCNRIGKITKNAPPPSPSLGEEWLFFRYNLKDLYSLLGKHLMQLPECMWRSWLMSGSLVWWNPPFLLSLLVVSFVCLQSAFQTVNAEEEEEGCTCIVLSSNYLVILTSVFLEAAKFTSGLHLTLQSPVIWSLDKTGLLTSVIADCLHLLTLSTWTLTKPVLNGSVKIRALNLFSPPFPSCIVFYLFHALLLFPTHLIRKFLHLTYLIIKYCSRLWLIVLASFLLFCSVLVTLYFPEYVIILNHQRAVRLWKWESGVFFSSDPICALRPVPWLKSLRIILVLKDEFRKSGVILLFIVLFSILKPIVCFI